MLPSSPENDILVTITEQEITCRRPDGTVESVTWQSLRAVIIETNDLGPFCTDVFWILIGDTDGCVIPQGANGESELLHRLQILPGFNNEAVIEAMGSTDNNRFLCWKRDE